MRQIPILFSTPMVQALLQNRKTVTRRVCADQKGAEMVGNLLHNDPLYKYYLQSCKYGQPGDILWVRETFAFTKGIYEPVDCYSYKADDLHFDTEGVKWNDPDLSKEVRWKPSIHMPRKICRIFLQIKSVRIERLQDISIRSAIAEGIESWKEERMASKQTHYKIYHRETGDDSLYSSCPKISYQSLWQKINGVESWEANPFVWVIEFNRLKNPPAPPKV